MERLRILEKNKKRKRNQTKAKQPDKISLYQIIKADENSTKNRLVKPHP